MVLNYDEESDAFGGELEQQVSTILSDHFDAKEFDELLINEQFDECLADVLRVLAKLARPYKYIINGNIMQNMANSMSSCTCFWDVKADKHLEINWTNRTKAMRVQLFIYSVAI